jgi:hypothetical protein
MKDNAAYFRILSEKNISTELVLCSGYRANVGIFRYKKSFAPNGVSKFYIGKRVFNNKTYSELSEIRKSESNFDPNSTFFPLYRQ